MLYLLFALIGLTLVQQWWREAQNVEVVPYSEFETLLAQGRIVEIIRRAVHPRMHESTILSPFLNGNLFPKRHEYSEQTPREIDVAVRDIVKAAYDKALAIMSRDKRRTVPKAA